MTEKSAIERFAEKVTVILSAILEAFFVLQSLVKMLCEPMGFFCAAVTPVASGGKREKKNQTKQQLLI